MGKIAQLQSTENIVVDLYRPAGKEGFKTGYSLKTSEKLEIPFTSCLKIVKSLMPTSKGKRLYKLSSDEYECIDCLYYISSVH
jgi:hypothetical protein